MKHRLLKLGVFLLLGAIVNVVMAWGSSFRHQFINQTSPLFSSAPRAPLAPAQPSDWDQLQLTYKESRFASKMEQFEGPSSRALVWEFYSGWPILAFQGQIQTDATGPHATWPHAFVTTNAGGMCFCLPIVPLWPGFAINAIFYAALLWLMWIAPGKVRRFIRIRQGCCPTCGFIIAPGTCANGLCSECGAALPPRRGAGM